MLALRTSVGGSVAVAIAAVSCGGAFDAAPRVQKLRLVEPGPPALGVGPRGPARHRARLVEAVVTPELEQRVPEVVDVRRGLATAVAAGRLSRASAAQHRATLVWAATTIGRVPYERATILLSVLRDVATQSAVYNEPRALVLFGMLAANTRYLARHDFVEDRQDIGDAAGIVYRFYAGHGFQFQPLASFARLNRYVTEERLDRAARLAYALLARGIPHRGARYWEYYFPFQGPSRWVSGFVQAVAAQALARAELLVADPLLAVEARSAFRAITPSLVLRLGGGAWIREYGFDDVAILNAQLQTLVSLDEYAAITEAAEVHRLVGQVDRATRTLLPRFDLGCWSLYALGLSAASPHYHSYHVELLRRLAAVRPAAIWRRTAARWSRCARASEFRKTVSSLAS